MQRVPLLLKPITAALMATLVLGDWPLSAVAQNPVLSPFPTTRHEIAHGPHWTSTMERSVVSDAAIDAIIKSLVVDDCYPGEITIDDGRCKQQVTAKLVRSIYLVITLESSEYQTGAPHGSDEVETRTFKKVAGNWLPVQSNMISETPGCQKRIGDFVYKRIRPDLPSDMVALLDTSHRLNDLDPPQVLTETGIILDFQQYEFGAYNPPVPVTLSWLFIGSCFEPRIGPVDSQK